jgi:type IV secretory pathway VirD2 relaxase
VATSTHRQLDHALIDVRKNMIRQIEDQKTKRDLHKTRTSRRAPLDGSAVGTFVGWAS